MRILKGSESQAAEGVRIMASDVALTLPRKPRTFSQQPSKTKGATTMNASNMTRTEAGNELDRLTKEMMDEKDLSYEAAFDKVCRRNPALFNAYLPAAARKAG